MPERWVRATGGRKKEPAKSIAGARFDIDREQSPRKKPGGAGAPRTLAVDIGGSRIKASVLDATGEMIVPRLLAKTPEKPDPEAVLAAILTLARQLPAFDRISAGFPGVLRGGEVVTAPNLGTGRWAGFDLGAALSERFGRPARVLNDAAVQGLGAVKGHGLECAMTLGTGIGCALFRDGRLLLHLEIGQHRARKKLTYDAYIGQAALDAIGTTAWNARLARSVDAMLSLTACDVLYVGGGNARHIARDLPANVEIVSNAAGVTGGVRLWDRDLDPLFQGTGGAARGRPGQ